MSGEHDTVTFRIRRTWVYAIVGAAVGFVAGFGVAQRTRGTEPAAAGAGSATAQLTGRTPPSAAVADVSVEGRPFLGSRDAPVTLVEFTDYQCPYCARHHRETKSALLRRYEGRLRYVVRNFPLPSIHPLAQKAAEAAECARDQGAFFEYIDVLYTRSPELAPEQLERYAADLDLDAGRFAACLDSGDKAAVVRRDVEDGMRYGVQSTPTFFVNGQRVIGAQPLATFEAVIDGALREAAR